jgi:hypothetical protein
MNEKLMLTNYFKFAGLNSACMLPIDVRYISEELNIIKHACEDIICCIV